MSGTHSDRDRGMLQPKNSDSLVVISFFEGFYRWAKPECVEIVVSCVKGTVSVCLTWLVP